MHGEHLGYEDSTSRERVQHGALTLQGGPTVPQFRSLEPSIDTHRIVVPLDVDEPRRPPTMRSVALTLGSENASTECTANPRHLLNAAASDGHRATVPTGSAGGDRAGDGQIGIRGDVAVRSSPEAIARMRASTALWSAGAPFSTISPCVRAPGCSFPTQVSVA